MSPDAPDADRTLRLLHRITRAQKVIAGVGALGVLIAVIAASPGLPWPLSPLRSAVRSMVGADGALLAADSGPYKAAVLLQALVLFVGLLLMWSAMSWRMGRWMGTPPSLLLTGFAAALIGTFFVLNRSPAGTLWSWIVIAALAVAYLNYYRKGRFGFTRGASAAVFAHVTLICFFVAFPLVLMTVLSGARASIDTAEPGCGILMMTPRGCPRDPQPLPAHDRRPISGAGRVEIATDATSTAELRALFAAQRRHAGPSALAHPTMEVRIRCASVPDAPGFDPELATGWFALTEQGARQMGLRSTDDVVFERSQRRDCDPPPLPPDAISPEEVFAALERVGLRVTDPRPETVSATIDTQANGLGICYVYDCVRQIATDQVTVTVWPTAQAARLVLDDRAPGRTGGRHADGLVLAGEAAGGWIGAVAAGMLDPFDGATLFGPMTTVHLSAPTTIAYEEAIGCRDTPDACMEAYNERVRSAAAMVEQVAPR